MVSFPLDISKGGTFVIRSIHPYEPYIPENATKLIIGTMPPFRFCVSGKRSLFANDVDFYYGSKDNAFWKLLSEVTGVTLDFVNSPDAVNQRKQLLMNLHMGITDIVGSCIHHNGKADDTSLLTIEVKPLDKLLLDHPNIQELVYTNRGEVKKYINHFFADKGYHNRARENETKESVFINGKKYAVTQLYSPSPNALRSVSTEKRLQQYKSFFQDTL